MTEGSRAAWRDNHGFREPLVTLAEFLPLTVAASVSRGASAAPR